MSEIKIGDSVMTAFCHHGEVVKIEDDIVTINWDCGEVYSYYKFRLILDEEVEGTQAIFILEDF